MGLWLKGAAAAAPILCWASIVTSSAVAAGDSCANGAVRTQQDVGYLAECRAYEQVSPTDKNGNPVLRYTAGGAGRNDVDSPLLVGEDGNSALFSYTGADDASHYGGFNPYRAVRGSDGWHTTLYGPARAYANPIGAFVGMPQIYAASADTSKVLYWEHTLHPGFTFTERLTWLSPAGEKPVSVGQSAGPDLPSAGVGALSADGSRAIFTSTQPLVPAATAADPGASQIYERDLTADGPTLVSVLPDGSPAPQGAVLGNGPYNIEGNSNPSFTATRGAVSRDASRVVFAARPSAGDPLELYSRIDGARTLRLTEPQRSSAGTGPVLDSYFEGATPDGSSVFFLSDAQLTDDDSDADLDLYRATLNAAGTASVLTRLSADLGSATGVMDHHIAYVASSDDGQVVYFVSYRALGGEGTDGAQNLYVVDHGVRSFVGTLNVDDKLAALPAPNDLYFGSYRKPQTRLTPDGRTLILQSVDNLTGFGSNGAPELYRKVLGQTGFDCISCTVVGGVAEGGASLTNQERESIVSPPKNLSGDGRWIFFQSKDALIPRDTNGKQDVYQWHDGAVSLITSGTGVDDALFIGTSASNEKRDVFFASSQQLAWTDQDGLADLYTARVGGGQLAPPAPAPECLADCQGPSAPAPFVAIPATSTFAGTGNAKQSVTLAVGSISAAQRAALARTGKLTISVKATAAGRITATMSAKEAGKWRVSSMVSRSLDAAGTLTLKLSLSKSARQRLKAARHLAVRVDVRHARAEQARRATLEIRPASSAKRAKKAVR